ATVAPRYNDPPRAACPTSPLFDAMLRAVNDSAAAASRPVPVADGRLCNVAAAVLELMLGGGPPPQPAVEFALAQAGIVEPAPNFLVLEGDARQVAALVIEFNRRLAAFPTSSDKARLGYAVAARPDGRSLIALLLQDSFVDLDPLPRQLAV